MPGFLSIPTNMLPELVVEEITGQALDGQVQKAIVHKGLKRNHIAMMQSLAQWYCHLMDEGGKPLTNDEWHNLDRESFIDFQIRNPISFKSLPVVQSSSSSPAVPTAMTSQWHHFHLSELGGESSKPIQEVVISQTVLEGEPSTLKMVMMPTHSSEDLIESIHLSETCEDTMLDEHEDKANQCPTEIKSLVSVDCNKFDEIVSYKNKEFEYNGKQKLWRSMHECSRRTTPTWCPQLQ